MTVITVQAGVGAHLLGTQPEQAAESLRIIEQSGREALGEMRRMLWMLRDGESGEETADPQPGLTDLPRLTEAVKEARMEVTMRTVGEPRSLPAGLDLTLYRIVQEALTNVSKHAPGASASVAVRHGRTSVTAEVVDDGGAALSRPADPVVPGQGIRGMTERARMYGGAIETVWEPTGFRVTATFPLEPAE